MIEQVVIVGAGPAGLATAIQLKRYGIEARIFESTHPGGLLWNANLVENYPGFPGGISGPDLVRSMIQQAEQHAIQLTLEIVENLTWEKSLYQIDTDARCYSSRCVVIASGTQPRTFPTGFVPERLRERVFYEVYPLLERKIAGAEIGIVGAGDAAFDYAINLARQNRVLILNRSQEVKCLPLLWERAGQDSRICYLPDRKLLGIKASSTGQLELLCQTSSREEKIYVDYLLGAIGRVPRLGFISPDLGKQEDGLQSGGMLYYIGDVKNGIYRQTAIAVGDGLLAAMKIYSYFKEIQG
jgi:thioredoxin reductase (NADPH)